VPPSGRGGRGGEKRLDRVHEIPPTRQTFAGPQDRASAVLVGRVALAGAPLLQEHLAEMRDGMGEHRRLIFFGYEIEDRVSEGLRASRQQISAIRVVPALDILLHHRIDVAVEANRHESTRSVTLGLCYMWAQLR